MSSIANFLKYRPRGVGAVIARLKARPDSEHEQAILRILLVGLITGYMWIRASSIPGHIGVADNSLLFGLLGFFVVALALFAAICVSPAANPARRIVGMLADAGGTTFALFLTGDHGVGLVGVYLFITFGNGFRFGRTHLFICQALSLAGFLSVVIFAPWWKEEAAVGWGLVISLIVLPLYVSTLLKRIQEARARAEEANRAKSSFLANMSHEMRTPLNGIVGVADLLQTTQLNAEQSELMRLLRHSVSLLRSLVDDVLDISKIEAGRLSIEIVDFDLHATLNGLVRLLRPHAQAKGIALRAMVDPAIDYQLRGDPHHLRQVLLNLISNAIKFTERGEIAIQVTHTGETDEGFRVRFEVRDTGIGIGQEAQGRIFEQFVQADDSTTRRYGGTGLGTSIAKQLVELMGGAIGVTSNLGIGSTFWFEVPILRAVKSTELLTADQAEAQDTAILVAKADNVDRYHSLIAAACGRVLTVQSGDAAIAQLRALKQQCANLAGVFVAGSADMALEVFEQVVAEQNGAPTAMIYLAQSKPGGTVGEHLRDMDGVIWLHPNVSVRVLRNAIHSATTSEARDGAEIIDLGAVLKQQRQPIRILVADDNRTNQSIIRQLLESAGHTVLLASDGEEALDIYEEQHPELAILDFNMPERSGIEVLTAIRTMEPPGVRLPAVILSASVTPETRERARQAGADEFVGKPFDAASVLQVVDRLARRSAKGAKTVSSGAPPAQVALGAIPLLDRNRLREVESITRDQEFLTKLIRGFTVDVEGLLKRLDTEVAGGKLHAVPDLTHGIKGASVGIGAQQLAARCAEIDQAVASGQISRVRTLLLELRRCFDATSAQLNGYTAEKSRAAL